MSRKQHPVCPRVGRRGLGTSRSAAVLCIAYACSDVNTPGAKPITAVPDAGVPSAPLSSDATAPKQACELRLSSGHGDLYIRYTTAEGPSLHVRAELVPGAGETLFDPERVCVEVPQLTYEWTVESGGRPAADTWDFLGQEAGQPFWFLPQVARAGAPWFGVAADSVPGPALVDSWLLTLSDLEAPRGGELSLWASDPFGHPSPLLSTAAGLIQTEVTPGSHAHFNWGFTSGGAYRAVFEVRALDDSSATRAQATFRFEVVP